MERLHFEYHMEIHYTVPVSQCYFTIKCIPKDDARQCLLAMEISLLPETNYSYGEDSYNNKLIFGHVEEVHDKYIPYYGGCGNFTDRL